MGLLSWWRRRRQRRQPAVMLVCMRLDDMHVMHPEQITALCSRCLETVGIYPSGQNVLARHDRVEIVCGRCVEPGADSIPAPGAIEEIGAGVRWREDGDGPARHR